MVGNFVTILLPKIRRVGLHNVYAYAYNRYMKKNEALVIALAIIVPVALVVVSAIACMSNDYICLPTDGYCL